MIDTSRGGHKLVLYVTRIFSPTSELRRRKEYFWFISLGWISFFLFFRHTPRILGCKSHWETVLNPSCDERRAPPTFVREREREGEWKSVALYMHPYRWLMTRDWPWYSIIARMTSFSREKKYLCEVTERTEETTAKRHSRKGCPEYHRRGNRLCSYRLCLVWKCLRPWIVRTRSML